MAYDGIHAGRLSLSRLREPFGRPGDLARENRGSETIAEPFQYRDATNADCAAVEQLVFDVLAEYGLAAEPEGVDADLRDLEGAYFERGGWFGVWLDENGAIIGSAGLCKVNDTTCELRKMYLRASARGRGYGNIMIGRALTEANQRGFVRIELETAGILKEAIALYEKFGFRRKPLGTHCAKRCDVAMVLDLPTA
ncbi:MAG: GNAT family N-acetyltransferase [Candidatus Hydrogenedentes bacterium]|nr:GNAT family N-acetyltransferase [Candidatus Hydrogenedentota bacterium]